MLVYDTNPVHFLLVSCNVVKWIQKTHQLYDPESEMVWDAHFLRLKVNNSYNQNMKSVDLNDQLCDVYQVGHWIRKYKCRMSLLFLGHDLILVNV